MCLCTLGPAAAHAATVTVGENNLVPGSGNLDDTGAEIPVFQGDTSGGYTLSSPQSGTVTSFSFLSAGAATGSRFELVVLQPAAGEGNWTLSSVSPPVEVTTKTAEEALDGPYAVSLPIAAGDRIGLQPVGGEDTPIALTMNLGDGVRYFGKPFSGAGSTQTIAPESSFDHGQVLPLQATVNYTPSEASPASPPADTTPPTVAGAPQAGQTLKCEPGAWTDGPTFTYTWSQSTSTLVPGAKPPKVTTTDVRVSSGPTYTVPDLPDGVSIFCTVTASNAATAAGAGPHANSAPVAVQPLAPVLAPSFSFVYHTKRNQPSVSAGVGLGGVNVCRPGIWLHYPTRFAFAWFEKSYNRRLRRDVPVLIGAHEHLLISQRLELREIYCRVTASNSVGGTTATSNTVFVPRLAPKALGPVRVEFTLPGHTGAIDPTTSRREPFSAGESGRVTLRCLAPHFNRHAKVTYIWYVQGYAIAQPTGPAPAFDPGETISGSSPVLEVSPEAESERELPQKQPLLDGHPPTVPFTSWDGELAVQCGVKAHILHTSVYSVTDSPVFYLLSLPAPAGGIGGRAADLRPILSARAR